MTKNHRDKYRIRRRSSAHSAYWMSNALVPAGLILIYKHGVSLEGFLGIAFVALGATGYGIYKQKMSVPLIRHDGEKLTYSPSDRAPCSIKMDANSRFTIKELAVTAEQIDDADSAFVVSRLDFNSNEDWDFFVKHLRNEPHIKLHWLAE